MEHILINLIIQQFRQFKIHLQLVLHYKVLTLQQHQLIMMFMLKMLHKLHVLF